MLTESELLGMGFDEKTNYFTKDIGGKHIRCYKVFQDARSWICEIWTSYEPVQNTDINSKNDLKHFIAQTCPSNPVTMADIQTCQTPPDRVTEIDSQVLESML